MPSDDRYPDRRAFLRGTAAAVAAAGLAGCSGPEGDYEGGYRVGGPSGGN
jgi:hypothetical protein